MDGKLSAYLGFALRARKIALGVNAVSALSGGVYVLVADRSASENTKKEIARLARKFACPLVEVDGLENSVGKDFCKLAAVRDENLARAIAGVEARKG